MSNMSTLSLLCYLPKTLIFCSCAFPCGKKNTRFYLSSKTKTSAGNRTTSIKESTQTVLPNKSIWTTIETCVPSVVHSRGREGWGMGEGEVHLNEMCVW